MKALEHLRALVGFAYANGYHELGYDPVAEVESELDELARHADHLNSSIVALDEKLDEAGNIISAKDDELLQTTNDLDTARKLLDRAMRYIEFGSGMHTEIVQFLEAERPESGIDFDAIANESEAFHKIRTARCKFEDDGDDERFFDAVDTALEDHGLAPQPCPMCNSYGPHSHTM